MGSEECRSESSEGLRGERFLALYSSHERRLYLSLLPTPVDAENVFQAANLVLWRKFDQFRAAHELLCLGLPDHPLRSAEIP